MSMIDRFFAAVEDDLEPISQEAVAQPLERYGRLSADPELGPASLALAMKTRKWLIGLFDSDSAFYPDLELTSTICADLSAFLAHRLVQRNAQLHPSDLNLRLEALASMMYPRSERCVAAMDQLAACEAAEPSADAAQIWARAVRDAVDLMVLGSVESVNLSNARALLLRLTLLPTTLPYDNEFPNTVEAIASEIETAKLGGGGPWHAPLNAEQIQHAVRYGIREYGTAEKMNAPDLYDIYFVEPKILMTIATVYGRIAAYAGQVARVGQAIEAPMLEQLNFNDPLREHFGVRLISQHKRITVIAFDAANNAQPLLWGENTSTGGGQYSLTGYFPIPGDPMQQQQFEVSIPQMFGRPKTFNCGFDFSTIH